MMIGTKFKVLQIRTQNDSPIKLSRFTACLLLVVVLFVRMYVTVLQTVINAHELGH